MSFDGGTSRCTGAVKCRMPVNAGKRKVTTGEALPAVDAGCRPDRFRYEIPGLNRVKKGTERGTKKELEKKEKTPPH